MKILINGMVTLLMVTMLASCQSNGGKNSSQVKTNQVPQCIKGSAQCCGKTRGTFLGDWFDYYERGLSFADCLMWPEAYNDLSIAINKRGQDKRRVYTLGMHFITNYFPQREIGVVLYHQGKYQLAKKHLEISLTQFPSTKAETYLNNTRIKLKAIIEQEKSAPKIFIETKDQWTNIKGRAISLTITDDTFIEKVWIDGESIIWQDVTLINKTPVSIQRAKPLIILTKVLASNSAEIIVEAQDIFGNKTIKKIANRVDVLQPEIIIERIEENEYGEIEVVGIISDVQSGIAWLDVGEGKLKLAGEKKVEFSFVAMNEYFTISAKDIAGNQLNIKRRVNFTQPLTIDLQSVNDVSTQEDTWILSGWIESSHNIDSYTIDGALFSTKGMRLHISHEINLQVGVNLIEIKAQDESGHSISQVIQVTRTIPHYLAINERLLMALFPFACDQNTGAECKNTQLVYQQMDEQVRERQRFQLVERATLSDQLDSLKICELMVTDKCAWQAAQLVKTQSMFVGEMIVRKSPNSTSEEVYARIIDADNGSVLISFDAYVEGKNREDKSRQTNEESINKQLYVKLHERFPLLSTENITLNGDEVIANFGSGFKLWQNMPMKLFSDEQACAQGLVVKYESDHVGKANSTIKVELSQRCKAKGKKRLVTL